MEEIRKVWEWSGEKAFDSLQLKNKSEKAFTFLGLHIFNVFNIYEDLKIRIEK